jgi:hypothetical protein
MAGLRYPGVVSKGQQKASLPDGPYASQRISTPRVGPNQYLVQPLVLFGRILPKWLRDNISCAPELDMSSFPGSVFR